MDPLALVAASGGRVHDAQGEEVREGSLAFAHAGCQELDQTLKKVELLMHVTLDNLTQDDMKVSGTPKLMSTYWNPIR